MARYAHAVTPKNEPITESYPAYALTERELLEAVYVQQVALLAEQAAMRAEQVAMRADYERMLSAWTTGGLRALRKAASNGRD